MYLGPYCGLLLLLLPFLFYYIIHNAGEEHAFNHVHIVHWRCIWKCLLPLVKAELFRGKVIQFEKNAHEVKCTTNREKGRGEGEKGGGGNKLTNMPPIKNINEMQRKSCNGELQHSKLACAYHAQFRSPNSVVQIRAAKYKGGRVRTQARGPQP